MLFSFIHHHGPSFVIALAWLQFRLQFPVLLLFEYQQQQQQRQHQPPLLLHRPIQIHAYRPASTATISAAHIKYSSYFINMDIT